MTSIRQGRYKDAQLLQASGYYHYAEEGTISEDLHVAKMTTATRDFTVVYKCVDGVDIATDVYLPNDKSLWSKELPVLINIHGGAWMLGARSMVNKDQVKDCLDRGWIVVVPDHRLCPQVNVLEGPMSDVRDLLAWIHDDGLETSFSQSENHNVKNIKVDKERIMAFGTSSGGHLALSLGWGVPKPVAAIHDMYGPCNFSDPFWQQEIPHIKARMPQDLSRDFLDKVYDESPIPTRAGISLEGQALPPDFTVPRQAFALSSIANGRVLDAIYPDKDRSEVDALEHITAEFPPTYISHGLADTSVPIHLSRTLFAKLKEHNVVSGMSEIEGEEHTFAAKMVVGSPTWLQQRKGFDFLQNVISRDSKSSTSTL